jgi:serine/threonine protein kinase
MSGFRRVNDLCTNLNNNADGLEFFLDMGGKLWSFEVPVGSSVCRTLYSLWIDNFPGPMSYDEFKLTLLARQEGSSLIFNPPRPVIIIYAIDKHTPVEVIIKGDVFRPSSKPSIYTQRSQALFYQSESGSWTVVKLAKRGNINDPFNKTNRENAIRLERELQKNEQINALKLSPECDARIVRLTHHEPTPDGEFEALVMEGFDVDLFRHLQREYSDRPPAFEDVLKLIHTVLYGTQCLHEKNLILTDIKPLNIVLTKKPFRVGIIDFDGLLDAGPGGTAEEEIANSSGFVSMETLRSGRMSFDNDVFAIGMTLFQIITLIDPPPLRTQEDFQQPRYQEIAEQMLNYMNQRMAHYDQENRDTIVQLYLKMTAFLPFRAKIPDLLTEIESMIPESKTEESQDDLMGT